jgi:hypothetical protein
VYGDEYKGNEGKLILEAIVAKLPEDDADWENNLTPFRIIEIKEKNGAFYERYKACSYMHLYGNDTFLFTEEHTEEIRAKFEKMLYEELNAPYIFNGYDTVCGGFDENVPKDIKITGVYDLDDAIRYAYENYPQYYFGSSIHKDFPQSDFAFVDVIDGYYKVYQTNDFKECLIAYGEDKGWCTSKAMELDLDTDLEME